MEELPRSTGPLARLLALVGATIWIGIGLGVGWAVGFLADRLAQPAHHGVVVATLVLCGLVLVGWAYGSWLLYLEVRAGVEEATSDTPVRRRTGYRYVAIAAAPIIGALIALSSSSVAGHRAGGSGLGRTEVTATTATHRRGTSTAATSYVVRPGDRLTTIAERFYGDPADWTVIARANAGRLHEGARLVDPSLLPVGMELSIPDASTAPPRAPADSTPSPPEGSPGRGRELYGVLAGFGLLGAAIFVRRQLRQRAWQMMRTPAGAKSPAPDASDAAIEARLRPLVVAELPEWIDGANRLLCAALVADPGREVPRVSIVRAGPLGVELLLEESNTSAPGGFLALDGGRTWRLDPTLELEELRARAGPDSQPLLAGLIPLGEDDTGSYLVACGPGESLSVRGDKSEVQRALGAIAAHLANAPWGEVAFYRVGPADFVGGESMQELDVSLVAGLDDVMARDPLWRAGLPEHQPIVFVQDPVLAEEVRAVAPGIVSVIGTMLEADRVLFYDDGEVVVEPLGLRIRAVLPSVDELQAVARLRAVASRVPERATEAVALPSPESSLPVAGPLEVRLLRPIPDLVGDVEESQVKADMVQLVAYLALHGRQATMSRLRDAFGVHNADASRSQRRVWNAASATRALLGAAYFPIARGQRPYTIAESVTCDWLRFKQIVAIARALELAGETRRAVEALTVALELVGDGPPCSHDSIHNRYVWLDAEQFLLEMHTQIVEAAHRLAMLSIEQRPFPRSLEDAEWAIARGRAIEPDARPLRESALLLADAKDDAERIEAEIDAAVDAVDALDIGEDIDPQIEAIYNVVSRRRRQRPPPKSALA